MLYLHLYLCIWICIVFVFVTEHHQGPWLLLLDRDWCWSSSTTRQVYLPVYFPLCICICLVFALMYVISLVFSFVDLYSPCIDLVLVSTAVRRLHLYEFEFLFQVCEYFHVARHLIKHCLAFALQLYLCVFIYLFLSPTTTMGPTSCLCLNSFRSVSSKMFNTFQIWKTYSDFWRHLKLPMSLFHQGPLTQERSLKSGTDVSEIKTHCYRVLMCLFDFL